MSRHDRAARLCPLFGPKVDREAVDSAIERVSSEQFLAETFRRAPVGYLKQVARAAERLQDLLKDDRLQVLLGREKFETEQFEKVLASLKARVEQHAGIAKIRMSNEFLFVLPPPEVKGKPPYAKAERIAVSLAADLLTLHNLPITGTRLKPTDADAPVLGRIAALLLGTPGADLHNHVDEYLDRLKRP